MQPPSPSPSGPTRRIAPAVAELGEAAFVLAAVVAFGLGCALWLGPARLSGAAYLDSSMTPPGSSGSVPPAPSAQAPPPLEPAVDEWLVDGFNLLHAVLLGGEERSQWWTAAARERVLAAVEEATRAGDRDATVTPGGAAASASSQSSVWVVFDGNRSASDTPTSEAGRLQSVFAPSADEWLVRRVKQAREPSRVVVVTADRKLANRARHHGAQVLSPRDFLARAQAAREPGEQRKA